MAVGTAGFTAALSVIRMEERGLEPSNGPVLVTGASSGIGAELARSCAALGARVVLSGRNVKKLVNLSQSIFKQSRTRVSTGEINRVIRAAVRTSLP